MMGRYRAGILLVALAAAVGCSREAREAAEAQAVAQAIRAAREAFVVSTNADDLDGIMAVIPEDCVVMPPHEPVVVGFSANQRWHEERMAQFTTRMQLTPTDMRAASDWAVEWFRYDLTLTPRAAGDTVRDTGRLMWQWHRQPDGAWKIRKAIWNSDQPLPTTD
jgi:ketosteroid isomerase-like protein